jgi:undecaprenyl-phosphate 4-deoxy-4-formamido-L-arabinose transferase|tara:strand:+ start:507 stop:1289 length:783 start_codon:yes stop_codon:yes gene_type:complete
MKLSIIIPVYNSSEIIETLVDNIKFYLNKKLNNKFEIILVNDCSIDNSWFSIKNLAKKYSFIKAIDLKENIGQHAAIFVGLKFSKGDKIIVMDDDLQHPPSSLITIYNKLNDFDTCYTLYLKRKHIFWKILTSNINNLFSSFIFNKPYKIYLSSFKGFSSEVKNKFIGTKLQKVFLDSLILKYSKNITSINIVHRKRFEGDSNYNVKKLFNLWFDMIENFHFYPLRFGSFIGIISFLFIKLLRIFKKEKKFTYKIKNKTF